MERRKERGRKEKSVLRPGNLNKRRGRIGGRQGGDGFSK